MYELKHQALLWAQEVLGLSKGSINVDELEDSSLGLHNKNYRFSFDGHDYFLRIPYSCIKAKAGALPQHFQAEKCALERARSENLEPSFIAIDTNKGFKLGYFLPELHQMNYHDDEACTKAISALIQIHSWDFKKKYKHFNVFDILTKFYKELDEQAAGRFDVELYRKLKHINESLERAQLSDRFCHNDFYAPNILCKSKGQIFVVDWEFAAFGNPLFDLANFFASSKMSFNRIAKFSKLYYSQSKIKEELSDGFEQFHHLVIHAMVLSCALWILWAQHACDSDTLREYKRLWETNLERFLPLV
ncbi:MAG: phosphotransferase [Coriobacteriia bacterium]|nr:phosphotransferase [Coriobacteriia bacterium]